MRGMNGYATLKLKGGEPGEITPSVVEQEKEV